MSGKVTRLKQVIVDRIRSGDYPVGHRLTSARTAASEFGVHSNTVSRIYRELADEGIVRTVHGSGTFVVSVPGPEHGGSAIDELAADLESLAEQARHLGLSRTAWDDLVAESSDRAFVDPDPGIWIVECSKRDVEALSVNLTTLLRRSVNPLLVNEVPKLMDDCGPHDIFLTTPFHYEEVSAMLGPERTLLNVNVVPTTDTLVTFAQLDPRSTINVVASNAPTLERLVRMVKTYARTAPQSAALIDSPEAQAMVRAGQVVVDTQSIHDRVMSWAPGGAVLTVSYQIEPTSLAFVREVLRMRELAPDARELTAVT